MAENVFEAFEKHLQDQDFAWQTQRAYLATLRDFKAWFEGTYDKAFAAVLVTPPDVRSYRAQLQGVRRLAPATVNRQLAALRSYMRWARQAGLLEHDPLEGVKAVKSAALGPRWLGRSEQQALRNAARRAVQLGDLRAGGEVSAPGYIWPRRDYALVVLLLNTGLRLAEVAALTLDDVEIKARSGKVIVRQGKGRKYRETPLNVSARKALRGWLAVRPDDEGDALFLSQKGGALSMRAIASRVAVLAQRAQLEGVSPHTLRHSFAKNLIDAGVSLEKVAALLGHASIAVTQRYITPSRADLQAAAESVAWEG